MTKELWINLPVENIDKSKEFYKGIGFTLNTSYNNDHSASFFVGSKKVVLMLFEYSAFKGFTNMPVTDTKQSTEVLFSIDAENKEEVDEMAAKAINAGGKSNHKPSEMNGWMYGCGFTDPDSHQWNVLYMDMNKAPK
jgi:predicted lactoylglutathione lyase